MIELTYEVFIRQRITQLRLQKNISEHKMSLDLGKSGSYIRNITSNTALPSCKELFNIITYFGMTPSQFFAPLETNSSHYHQLCERLLSFKEEDLTKIDTFLGWISDTGT